MIYKILTIVLTTLIPTLELRASIPLGIITLDMPWFLVFLIAVIANILLGLIIYLIIDNFIFLLLKIKIFKKFYYKSFKKTQRKIKPLVDKYGLLGIALFIAIPLPGSGSYTGALAAYILGMNFKKFSIANLIGVIIAGIIVTIITLVSLGILNLL